ncbi:hypothetical protein FLX07_19920 [Microbispora bryophytorum]|nr:hypothetical protein FLX07_19920 [Microbispora bryophytorum]
MTEDGVDLVPGGVAQEGTQPGQADPGVRLVGELCVRLADQRLDVRVRGHVRDRRHVRDRGYVRDRRLRDRFCRSPRGGRFRTP